VGVYANVAIVEPFDIADEYVSGLASIEALSSGEFRFLYYVEKRKELLIVKSMIMPMSGIVPAIGMSMQAIGWNCCGNFKRNAH